ncbi:uncharacterized protein LOC120269999 isoform X2 [Dioscorea cayenensis subsp. rotundata]|uniref:Uncharacterized protein LOC120269999 isoform X2 n=1 Tax=Dioscorea cayennensis subsp. rotundata TaxID=55577 RepID=A0AB40C0T8_DIOCR|nr:uncharacterized protein LOC120269999 isoform X2 [Dioscorea cayenensis subsp. rotundata]
MAGSMRAELASSSLDGSTFSATYPTGQRGSYSGASLDRSGSFRESLENRIMASGPGASRTSSPTVDVPPPSQHLLLDTISMSEPKYPRTGELRRVLGVSLEEHSFGSVQSKPIPPIALEELKRFKASLLESSLRARDRAKLLNDSIVKLEKYRSLFPRKRQRNETPLVEKPGGPSLLKTGNQVHQSPPDLVVQRSEERAKNIIPNKRARSSIADLRSEGRGNVSLRQGTLLDKEKNMVLDKDKNILRTCNGGSVTSDDKISGFSAGGDPWDKKMKRKRSVGMMVSRTIDADRELKPIIQQRPGSEPHPRPSEGTSFRGGPSNGNMGSAKMDGNLQLNGGNSRVTSRNDMDIGSLLRERKECTVGQEKERIITKGSNKLNIREDSQVGSQNPLTKGKASRAPRSGLLINSSNFPRTMGGNDGWEQTPSLSKVQSLSGPVNRKRPLPTGSASSPVAQWVGQRPQKMSRTRRTNVVSPVSNLDETQTSTDSFSGADVGARLTPTESSGLLLARGVASSGQLIKVKFENIASPAGFSESEESGAMDNKSKDKEIENGDTEDGGMSSGHRVSTLILPTKKNKLSLKEESGDGIRRQGRSGRSSMQSKAGLPLMKEKLEIGETNKPLRSGRPGSDRSERIGRPPSKKASDRKVHGRPMQIMCSISADLAGELNDDHEELLIAANAARNASYSACSSSFWKKVEPLFSFINIKDIDYVKQQINFVEQLDETSTVLDESHNEMGDPASAEMQLPHVSFSSQHGSNPNIARSNKTSVVVGSDDSCAVQTVSGKFETQRWFEKIIPLSQRLLSAFVVEYGMENCDFGTEQGDPLYQYSSSYSPFCTNNFAEDGNKEADFMKAEHKLEINFDRDAFPCNGHARGSKVGCLNVQNHVPIDKVVHENGVNSHSDNRSFVESPQTNLDQLQALSGGFSAMPNGCHYEQMSLDERILMELHSIDLYPETVPELAEGDDDEIGKDIMELKIRLYQQVSKTKRQLHVLEKAIQDAKEIEKKKVEQIAMNKVVDMAYKKLMGGRGAYGSSHKSGASKVSKQLAMAFAMRTLARCKKFEETGQSCFSEPSLHEVISAPPDCSDGKHLEPRNGPITSRVSGSMSNLIERNGLVTKHDRGILDPFQSPTHIPQHTSVKPDLVSSKGKRREVLLDDVVTGAASRATSTLGHTLPGGVKGKRTERERDPNKDAMTRNSSAKTGRQFTNGRGERKTKSKPKQKISQLSTPGHGLLGRVAESMNTVLPSMRDVSEPVKNSSSRVNPGVELPSSGGIPQDLSKELEDNIFTNLPLHGIDSIDDLDVEQGQDIGAWLNVDEDALQGHDLVGLEIPMDDLSEIKLNF